MFVFKNLNFKTSNHTLKRNKTDQINSITIYSMSFPVDVEMFSIDLIIDKSIATANHIHYN